MEKGIIKMVIIVMVIAITLLLASEYLAMYSGRSMMKSSIDSIQQQNQTSQDSGTGTSK